MMAVLQVTCPALKLLGAYLPLPVSGQGQQLGPSHPFGSTTFIGIDMRHMRTDDTLPRSEHGTQTHDIAACSAQREKNLNIMSKQSMELRKRGLAPLVKAVRTTITGVGLKYRLHDTGMNPRRIVAGKTDKHISSHLVVWN